MKSSAVIACLSFLFCVFSFPSCVHNDRGVVGQSDHNMASLENGESSSKPTLKK